MSANTKLGNRFSAQHKSTNRLTLDFNKANTQHLCLKSPEFI